MADLLNVKLITPKAVTYNGKALSVTIPAESGQMQVYKGHVPILARISKGEICIEKSGEDTLRFNVDEGFFRVTNESVDLLVDTIEST